MRVRGFARGVARSLGEVGPGPDKKSSVFDRFALTVLFSYMFSKSNSSGLRDNHTRGTVADFLGDRIQNHSKLSIVSAYFTIYAYDALKAVLDRIDHLDFLFGEPSFINRLDPDKTEKKSFLIDDDGLQLANQLQQKRVARECADWIERKVDIKTVTQSNLLHGKMYHIATAGVEEAILGSSNFTVRGLGLGAAGNNIELNLIVDSNRDRQELKQWFDEVWNDANQDGRMVPASCLKGSPLTEPSLEDFALSPEESRQSKESEELPGVLEYIAKNNLDKIGAKIAATFSGAQ